MVVGQAYSDSCHPYEVWMPLFDAKQGTWFAERYNYCTKSFVAVASPPSMAGPSQVFTGGGEVWGLNLIHQVMRFNPATGTFQQMPGNLAQLALGPSGIWGVDAFGDIFEFNPVSQTFDAIPGQLVSIAAGADGLWGANGTQQVYRYQASTRSFQQIFGAQINSVAAGIGGGVWGYDGTNLLVYNFQSH